MVCELIVYVTKIDFASLQTIFSMLWATQANLVCRFSFLDGHPVLKIPAQTPGGEQRLVWGRFVVFRTIIFFILFGSPWGYASMVPQWGLNPLELPGQ